MVISVGVPLIGNDEFCAICRDEGVLAKMNYRTTALTSSHRAGIVHRPGLVSADKPCGAAICFEFRGALPVTTFVDIRARKLGGPMARRTVADFAVPFDLLSSARFTQVEYLSFYSTQTELHTLTESTWIMDLQV
jgi:hypothetical protein